jgi:hypothetical protein
MQLYSHTKPQDSTLKSAYSFSLAEGMGCDPEATCFVLKKYLTNYSVNITALFETALICIQT